MVRADTDEPLVAVHAHTAGADVIVIGGGVVGSAVAYHLARDGHDAGLLDRRDDGADLEVLAANERRIRRRQTALGYPPEGTIYEQRGWSQPVTGAQPGV